MPEDAQSSLLVGNRSNLFRLRPVGTGGNGKRGGDGAVRRTLEGDKVLYCTSFKAIMIANLDWID